MLPLSVHDSSWVADGSRRRVRPKQHYRASKRMLPHGIKRVWAAVAIAKSTLAGPLFLSCSCSSFVLLVPQPIGWGSKCISSVLVTAIAMDALWYWTVVLSHN